MPKGKRPVQGRPIEERVAKKASKLAKCKNHIWTRYGRVGKFIKWICTKCDAEDLRSE